METSKTDLMNLLICVLCTILIANKKTRYLKVPPFNEKISKWGSLRYASNYALFLFGAARLEPKLERASEYVELGMTHLSMTSSL